MGYKLKGSKSLSHEIKGIVTEQIDNALDCLKRSGRNKDEGIHEPSIASFHEWRKQVKHLLYQSRVLTPLWHNTMKTLSGELKTLGEYLSEDHDLGILRDLVTEQMTLLLVKIANISLSRSQTDLVRRRPISAEPLILRNGRRFSRLTNPNQ